MEIRPQGKYTHPRQVIEYTHIIVVIMITIGGKTWTQTSAPGSNWISIASNSTGQFLVAAQTYGGTQSGYIYTSSSG